MGLYRNAENTEIDIVKEMAEGLGSTGLRLDEVLEQIETVRKRLDTLLQPYGNNDKENAPMEETKIRAWIRDHNTLVDKAHDIRHWLLIQREACGFRKHRYVEHFYPVPPKIKFPGT